MTTRCRVCTHPRRAEIEAAIRSGVSLRQVAVRFGVARSSIDRHMGNGHSLAPVALTGDVEVIQDVPMSRDPSTLLQDLKRASLDSFNLMRRRGDDPVAIAYLKEIRALLALEMEVADRKAARPDYVPTPGQVATAQGLHEHHDAIAKAKVIEGLKARLDGMVKAKGREIDLTPAPHPPVISVEKQGASSPVKTRTRHIQPKN